MDAYRDQYAKVFGDTSRVRLLAISVDPDTMLAAWAREQSYTPWTFLSDPGAVVGKKYGSTKKFPLTPLLDNRNLYIIGPDGRIAHVMAPFREIDPAAYTELTDMIRKVSGRP